MIHLVDSINRCHDVLSGAADDSLLASGTANSLMTVDDAVKSVCQCIRVSCSILRKPGVVDESMHGKMKSTINFSEIPNVCDSLVKRIYQLSSTNIISNMCRDTPDRVATYVLVVASVRAVLLYACETWPFRVEDVRRPSVFDHRCLRRIADIQWQHHVSNAEVRHRVFGHRDDNSIGVTILKHRLRWLGHVLRMSSQRISRRALFSDAGTGCKKRRGGQCIT
ncbi:unnamed protein product [Schistosoma margrebowiei]|uniref:Uncharacterized protein n=1 Tax=Schistosoma margrebowiei TaxID=48269 RepID=A0A3P8EEB7_9TREM|nr:unnamed protein product [Schistosoma margrebowiei]